MNFHIVVCCFFSAVLTSGLFAQTDNASVMVKQNEFDFGYVYEADGALVVTFKLVSRGEKPLKINRIVSPSFQIVGYTKDSLRKGEEGMVKVKFVPYHKSGDFQKTVKVFSNAKESPSDLTIRGFILSGSGKGSYKYHTGGLAFKQSQVNFGYIFKGEKPVKYIPVLNKSNKEITLHYKESPEHLQLVSHFKTLQPGQVGVLEIGYNSNDLNDWDFIYDRVPIEVESPNGEQQAILTVTSNVREDFSSLTEEERLISPKVSVPVQVFNFDTITTSQKASYEFLVRNEGERELKIRAVKPTCGCTAALPIKNSVLPGDSTYVRVEFNPEGYVGVNKKGVTLITNDPQNYKQFLWVTGYVEP